MNRVFVFLCLCMLCIGVSDVFSHDMDFFKYSAQYYKTGQLKKCQLKRTAVVQGITCRHWIRFFEDGTLKQFRAAQETEINGIQIPADTEVFLSKDGSVERCWFSRDMKIQGILCDGGAGKISTSFHENGKLMSCFLVKNQKIQGMPCMSSMFRYVMFYKSGGLRKFTLSEDKNIGGTLYRKGMTIEFDEMRQVVSAQKNGFLGIDVISIFN